MTDKNLEDNARIKKILKTLSSRDFKSFGLHQIAYIKPVQNKTKHGYAIFGADGEKLSVTDTLDKAVVIARQKDLEPVVVH
tara:strand:+ start:39219 stop:39461 length:243 start_codon:yes stop_codon:yes gene_type:complete